MIRKYQPSEFEKKWVEEWEKKKVYKTPSFVPIKSGTTPGKGKKYVLDMFPYPSGAGLHVGHPRGYTATDIMSRFYRMNGYNVLHPMGWDAFGLPAENAAIKAHKNPIDMVPTNIANFKRQMKMLGFSYDWECEFATTDPSYYRFTQWLFIQFFKIGLLYKKNAPINWCPFCKTGLSEEEVLPNGTHERCGNKIEKKELPQWIFKITKYADSLLAGLKDLKWPRGILEMQRNWIGRKEGVIIHHKVAETDLTLDTFSAFPAWLFADTFIVIAPEHPVVKKLVAGTKYEKDVNKFIEESRAISAEEREKDRYEKKGVFTGRYVLDPFNNDRKMPVWLANFAMMDFGTGIIRCSAHDVRDYEFAQKYGIELKEVVIRSDPKLPVNAHNNAGVLKDSGPFSGRSIDAKLIEEVLDWIEKNKLGHREVTYHLRDWIFSRQRYWGEPIPIIHCPKCGMVTVPENDLPLELPYVNTYEPTGTGESPLAAISSFVNTKCPNCGGSARRETDTMPNWAGSCWYFLAFPMWKQNSSLSIEDFKSQIQSSAWMPVDWYVGGAEHAVLHLLYARFWMHVLNDAGLVNVREPFIRLKNVGMILAEDHRKMSKSLGNVVNPDEVVSEYGADALRMYEMFMAPFSQEISWSTTALQGCYRFLRRAWDIFQTYKDSPEKLSQNNFPDSSINDHLKTKLQITIKKVSTDIEEFKFNTAIAAMMEFLNEWSEDKINILSREDAKNFVKILAPFAPFMTEEIWHEIFGEKESIHLSTWPQLLEVADEEIVTIPVQVNGKLRATLKIQSAKCKDQQFVSEEAVKLDTVKKNIGDKKYKVIYVPGKILNLVVG